MKEAGYRIIFNGDIAKGTDLLSVKNNLASLLKTDAATVERLFTNGSTVIKSNIDHETALKYKAAIEKCGALCRIELIEQALRQTCEYMQTSNASSRDEAIVSQHSAEFSKPATYLPALFIVPGLLICAVGMKIIPVDPASAHAPFWLIFLAGLLFVFGGCLMVAKRCSTASNLLINLTVTIFGVICMWGGLYGDIEIEQGIPFVSPETNVMAGRVLFIGIAVILFLVAFSLWKEMITGRNAWGTGGKKSTPEQNERELQQKLDEISRGRMATALRRPSDFLENHPDLIFVLSLILMVSMYVWNTNNQKSKNKTLDEAPIVYGDNSYSLTIPTTWKILPSDQTETIPAFGNRNGDIYHLLATSKSEPDMHLLVGSAGSSSVVTLTYFKEVGWEGLVSETRRKYNVTFSDTAEINGLTVYRVGYEIADRYREDAYFAIPPNLWKISFSIPNNDQLAANTIRLRDLVAKNLTGK